MPIEEDGEKVKRIWNGESTLQATMADLLNIWCISDRDAKYSNPYAPMEERQVPTFKALAETWDRPEIQHWHKYLGDFWGPIMLHLRRTNNWMTIAEAFETGLNRKGQPIGHVYQIKEDKEKVTGKPHNPAEARGVKIEEFWRRPSIQADNKSGEWHMFSAVLDLVKEAYEHPNQPVPPGIHRNINTDSIEQALQLPIEYKPEEEWDGLPAIPETSPTQIAQWVVDWQG
jgi:hypothetical protein